MMWAAAPPPGRPPIPSTSGGGAPAVDTRALCRVMMSHDGRVQGQRQGHVTSVDSPAPPCLSHQVTGTAKTREQRDFLG